MLDLLLVGHVTRDRLVDPEGRERTATGGAVYYGSIPARLLGVRVGVLTKLAASDHELLEELRAVGIALHPLASRATTVIQNHARSADLERRRFVVESVADPFAEEELLSVPARMVLCCALQHGELPERGVAALARQSQVALDVQGFIRRREGETLVSHAWPEAADVLAHVSVLKADRRETEILTGESDVARAIAKLAELGPRELLVTGGASILLFWEGRLREAALAPRGEVRGRTGRGDTAIASYLASRLLGEDPEAALARTAAIVSRKLEQPGPFRGPLPPR